MPACNLVEYHVISQQYHITVAASIFSTTMKPYLLKLLEEVFHFMQIYSSRIQFLSLYTFYMYHSFCLGTETFALNLDTSCCLAERTSKTLITCSLSQNIEQGMYIATNCILQFFMMVLS